MPRKPLAIVALVVVALLAGCTEKTPDGSGEEPNIPTGTNGGGGRSEGNGSQPPVPVDVLRSAEFVDCAGLVSAYHVDPATVDMKLPEGYSATGFLGLGPDAAINLEYYHCKTVILDNTTVLHNVSQAMVMVFANVPEETETPQAVNFYLFEWLTDNQEFHARANRFGVPIHMADINVDISDTTDGEASVTVDGELWYSTSTFVDSSDQFAAPPGIRKHHYVDAGESAWVLANETEFRAENLLRTAVTEIAGGILAEFPWASAGHLTGYGQYNVISGLYDFGRLE